MKKKTIVLTLAQARMLLKALSSTLRGHSISMTGEVADRIILGKGKK